MLPFLKKKPEAAVAVVAPLWHPNFRNFERLPDTKVVRTAFFINIVAITLAVAALLWFASQEYRLHELNRQKDEWQAQINRDKRGSDLAIVQYKKFQAEAARAAEVEAFVKSRPVVSSLLMHLGRTLPPNIALDLVDLRDQGVTLRATLRGAPDLASGYASAYVENLRADSVLQPIFDDIALINLSANPQTGRLVIEIFLKFRAAPDKDAKKP